MATFRVRFRTPIVFQAYLIQYLVIIYKKKKTIRIWKSYIPLLIARSYNFQQLSLYDIFAQRVFYELSVVKV